MSDINAKTMYSISSDVVDIQGYLWFTVYLHYFTPGRLKLETRVLRVPLYRLRELIDQASPLQTRRWLLLREGPYPGYCHAPGTSNCLPLLCDCDYLTKEWNRRWRDNNNATTGTVKNVNKKLFYKPIPTNLGTKL